MEEQMERKSLAEWFEQLPEREKLNHLLRMTGNLHRNITDKNMTKEGVYASQHRILSILTHHPNISQKRIAQIMEVSTPTIAVALKKMEKSGLISKVMNPDDNRFNQINVTEKGLEILNQGYHIMHDIDKDSLAPFSDEEIHVMLEFVRRYHEQLIRMTDIAYHGKNHDDI